jgi:hypothetical protein
MEELVAIVTWCGSISTTSSIEFFHERLEIPAV